MGKLIRILASGSSALFVALAIFVLLTGETKQAVPYLVVAAAIALIWVIGEFFHRYPPPPLVPGDKMNAFAQLTRYRRAYPGWQGKLVAYLIPALVMIALTGELIGLWGLFHL